MNNNKNFKETIYENYFSKKVQKNKPDVNLNQFLCWARLTHKRVRDWLPIDKNSKILDLGTGTGNFLIMMNSLGYKNLTGVDISDEQIKIAKSLSPDINFVKANLIEYLENNKDKYDLISLIDVLEHFERNEAYYFLQLINKSLIQAGRLIIQTPNAISPWMGAVCYGDLTHEWFYTPNSLDDLLIQCGYCDYESKEIAPVPIGIISIIKLMLWKVMKLVYKVINVLEIGSSGWNQIYSRVFIATAIKKSNILE